MISITKLVKPFQSALLLAGLCVIPLARAQASIFGDISDKDVMVNYRLAVAATISTAAIVIDLSDTTNWPHKETGELNISAFRIDVDKTAASTDTVKIGVVNFVDSSTGSVTWVETLEGTSNVSNTNVTEVLNFAPNYLRLRVNPNGPQTDGLTPFILSNDTTGGSTTYQTDVNLPSAFSAATKPGVGDLVVSVVNGAAAIVVNIQVLYHSNSR